MAGLQQPVEVLRDRWGVPHIYAKNATISSSRRASSRPRIGCSSSTCGGDCSGGDGRGVGCGAARGRSLRPAAPLSRRHGPEWTSYSPDTKEIATAFTRGINACIDHVTQEQLPIEFQLLGSARRSGSPRTFSGACPASSCAAIRQRNRPRPLIHAVGLEKGALARPGRSAACLWTRAPTSTWRGSSPDPGRLRAATRVLQFIPPNGEQQLGRRRPGSQSGKPLLASDPHRATPCRRCAIWCICTLPAGTSSAAASPACPGVALGHNDRIAWGFTIVGTDQADLFVERPTRRPTPVSRREPLGDQCEVVHESLSRPRAA